MRRVIAYLLILKFAPCYDQFVKNTCVGDVEIAFSTNRTDFYGARESCEKFGGDLVKIVSAEIQTAIENAMPIEKAGTGHFYSHYIGAFDEDGDNEYNWLVDNTSVPKNPKLKWPGPSTGYQNWGENQPNDFRSFDEKCVGLGVNSVHTWSDVNCLKTIGDIQYIRYICQRDFSMTIRNTDNSVTCQSPLSSVRVRWERNFVIVKSSNKGGVYQAIGMNNATLNYAKANITEAGTYTCTTRSSSCSATKTYTIAVDGTPIIQSIVGNKCNASLFVSWKPNKAAVGFIHRFSVNKTATTLAVTPTANRFHTTEIAGLEPNSEYTVQINVCEAKTSCTTTFIAEANGTTYGVTNPVTSATLRRSDVGCIATWNTPDNSATYTIERKCRVDKSRAVSAHFQWPNVTTESTAFLFQPGPNRDCSATIWAKGCGKISTSVKTTGICTTPPKEPDKIEPAELEDGTSKMVKFARPSEDNGLISCIFIVLCYDKCSETQLTLEDLEKASQTDVTNNTDHATSIALAISMSSISGNQIFRKLFQGEATSCDLYSTGLTTAASAKVLKGNNHVDNSSKDAWAYIVTSTPSEGRILFKTSSPTVVVEETRTGASGNVWVIGPIGLVVIVILIVLAGVLIARRQRTNDQDRAANKTGDQSQAISMQAISRPHKSNTSLQTASSDVAYEEVQQAGTRRNRPGQITHEVFPKSSTGNRMITDQPRAQDYETPEPAYEEIKAPASQHNIPKQIRPNPASQLHPVVRPVVDHGQGQDAATYSYTLYEKVTPAYKDVNPKGIEERKPGSEKQTMNETLSGSGLAAGRGEGGASSSTYEEIKDGKNQGAQDSSTYLDFNG